MSLGFDKKKKTEIGAAASMADQKWCYFQKGTAHMAFLCTQLLLMLYIPRQTLREAKV